MCVHTVVFDATISSAVIYNFHEKLLIFARCFAHENGTKIMLVLSSYTNGLRKKINIIKSPYCAKSMDLMV